MIMDILTGIGAYIIGSIIINVVVFGPLIYFAPELPWHD